MSVRIKARLAVLRIVTTHEERQRIDREVERRTGQNCEKGIDQITDDELRAMVEMVTPDGLYGESDEGPSADSEPTTNEEEGLPA